MRDTISETTTTKTHTLHKDRYEKIRSTLLETHANDFSCAPKREKATWARSVSASVRKLKSTFRVVRFYRISFGKVLDNKTAHKNLESGQSISGQMLRQTRYEIIAQICSPRMICRSANVAIINVKEGSPMRNMFCGICVQIKTLLLIALCFQRDAKNALAANISGVCMCELARAQWF